MPLTLQESLDIDMISMTNHRKSLLLYNAFQIQTDIKPFSTTAWEQIVCVGYNPEISRLETVVSIKLPTGYSGNLCSTGSTEYVRFFIDYHDGGGFQDVGIANFQAHDIPEVAPGTQHPIEYMVYKSLDADQHQKFISCTKAVIPTVRAILSWNIPPTADPGFSPFFGNIVDVNIQLKALLPLILNLPFDKLVNKIDPIQPDILIKEYKYPNLRELMTVYQKAEVPEHRFLYSTLSPILLNSSVQQKTLQFNTLQLKEMKFDYAKLIDILTVQNNFANVTYEELTCVGLNTATDTVGAVVKIKKSSGYSGDLCHKGSMEHVAFWADWNNDGVFEEYLGTSSFETHDISNVPADGIFYNVSLMINSSQHRESCANSNVIRIRAVLSWESLPSATDPNQLSFWGNRVDSLVQIRPGRKTGGNLNMDIFSINDVPVNNIDLGTGLAYNNTLIQNQSTNLPFGGELLISGRFYNSGAADSIHYKIQYSTNNGVSWNDVTDKQRFQITRQGTGLVLYNDDPTLQNNWFTYHETMQFPIQTENLNMLGVWNTGALNGKVHIRIAYTDEPYVAPFNPATINYHPSVSGYSVLLDNTGFNVNPVPGTAIDMAYTLDVALDDLDCAFVKPGEMIKGHLRAIDTYFSQWNLFIFPSNHYKPGQNETTTISPQNHVVSAIGDFGNATLPFTIDTANLDSCGYAMRLSATDRSLIGYRFYFPDGSYGFNITSHYGEKYIGFAVLPS